MAGAVILPLRRYNEKMQASHTAQIPPIAWNSTGESGAK
jgi:hypothetical protein